MFYGRRTYPSEADPRIEIVNGGIAYISVRDVLISGAKGRTYHVIELIVSFNGIGFEPVAQSDIQRKPAVYLPIVLNVRVHGEGALGAGGIGPAVRRSRELEGITGKEIGHAGESSMDRRRTRWDDPRTGFSVRAGGRVRFLRGICGRQVGLLRS